ncbi:hypothetical protein BDV23DRAFT_189258 [Aspergillus alliaceus]|uniref:Uncharacterized protein n=1 Tax=Petromyces alliaceus TaxID=209559 RepID=A0A5N7BRK4_PETAA|nr:hypothetical protein BDV23DRAFT_189258 [Aspergillus alliaceus]
MTGHVGRSICVGAGGWGAALKAGNPCGPMPSHLGFELLRPVTLGRTCDSIEADDSDQRVYHLARLDVKQEGSRIRWVTDCSRLTQDRWLVDTLSRSARISAPNWAKKALNTSVKCYASTIFRLWFCQPRSNPHGFRQNLNPGESTRPVSRLDALRRELVKAKRTSRTQGRESHTTSSTVDRCCEDSGASDPLDIEGTESDDGQWKADIDPQNIPALASALWDMLEYRFDDHISDNHSMCQAVGDISHRSATAPPTKVARAKRRKDDEQA